MKGRRKRGLFSLPRSPSLSFLFPFFSSFLSFHLRVEGGEGEKERESRWIGGWGNGEWILCPERDIWRPLRPGKNNINIGKEGKEGKFRRLAGSLAGWLAGPALGRGYQV